MVSDQVLISYISNETVRLALCIILISIALGYIFRKSSSEKHRELVTDLYVVGKIRQFAKEDNINLDEEMKELRRIEKLEKMNLKSLDNVVEDELKEKIQATNQKKIEEMTNKKA